LVFWTSALEVLADYEGERHLNSRDLIVKFLYLAWIYVFLPFFFPMTLRYLTNFDTYEDNFPQLPK
jgi:hypothetical protein